MRLIYCFTMLFLLFTASLLSCSSKNSKDIVYYKNGQIKSLIVNNPSNLKTEILFYENGELEKINKLHTNGQAEGEQLLFYSDGILKRKIHAENGKFTGNAYYFYDSTGTLNGHRYFRNGIPVFYGADYWEDSTAAIKYSLHFNDKGQIYYKKNFDNNGNFISEEGKR